MDRNELKEIIKRVIDQMREGEEDTPVLGCIYSDSCDHHTTYYAVGEEG